MGDRDKNIRTKPPSEGKSILTNAEKMLYETFLNAEYEGKLVVHMMFPDKNDRKRMKHWYRGRRFFIKSVAEGNVDIVRKFLVHGEDANAYDPRNYNSSVLLTASAGGHFPVVAELIKAGARLNFNNLHGRTPLMEAAKGGHLEVVQYLIRSGAHVHWTDENDNSALTLAREEGHLEVAKFIEDTITAQSIPVVKGDATMQTEHTNENAAQFTADLCEQHSSPAVTPAEQQGSSSQYKPVFELR